MSIGGDKRTARQKFIHHFGYLNSVVRFPRPFAQFAGKPNAVFHHMAFDDMGFRNEEPIGRRSDRNETRIFVLGGSTVVEGDTQSDTLSGRIESLLKRGGFDRVKVSNFGVVSSCFSQMSALVWSELADYDPDLIVVIGGGNDIANPWTFDPRPGYPYNVFVMEKLYDYLFDTSRDESSETGLSYDHLTDMLYQRLEELRTQYGWRTEAWELAIVEHARTAMMRFSTLASAMRTPIVCVLQPTIVRKKHLAPAETGVASDEFMSYLDRQYSRLEAVARELHANENANGYFHIRDLSRKFADEEEQIFCDAAHYAPRGRQIVAADLAETISSVLCSRRDARASSARLIRRVRKMLISG